MSSNKKRSTGDELLDYLESDDFNKYVEEVNKPIFSDEADFRTKFSRSFNRVEQQLKFTSSLIESNQLDWKSVDDAEKKFYYLGEYNYLLALLKKATEQKLPIKQESKKISVLRNKYLSLIVSVEEIQYGWTD